MSETQVLETETTNLTQESKRQQTSAKPNWDHRTLKQKIAEFHQDQELSPQQSQTLRQAEELLSTNDNWPKIKRVLLMQLRKGNQIGDLQYTVDLFSDVNNFNEQEREAATAYLQRRYEKRRALSELQAQAVDEQVDFANARVDLITKIKENPDTQPDELTAHLETLSKEGHLTPDQLQELQRWVEIYHHKRQNITAVRAEHPDDQDLVKHLYGIVPTNFQVVDGVVAIGIIGVNDHDYYKMHSGASFKNRKPSKTEIEIAQKSEGFLSEWCQDDRLNNQIIVLPDSILEAGQNPNDNPVYIHERKHVFNSVDIEATNKDNQDRYELLTESHTQSGRKRDLLIKQYFRSRRNFVETQSLDEIRAYKADGELSNPQIESRLTGDKLSGGHGFSQQAMATELGGLLRRNDQEYNTPLIDAAKQIFETEYQQIIGASLVAFDKVSELLNGDAELADAVLADQPLRKWRKTAKRMNEVITQKQTNAS